MGHIKMSVISLISNRDPGQEIGCPSHVCGFSTKWVELLPAAGLTRKNIRNQVFNNIKIGKDFLI